MYQSPFIYKFESNAKEEWTTCEVRMRDTNVLVTCASIPRYHNPAWIELHKAEALYDVFQSDDSKVVSNDQLWLDVASVVGRRK